VAAATTRATLQLPEEDLHVKDSRQHHHLQVAADTPQYLSMAQATTRYLHMADSNSRQLLRSLRVASDLRPSTTTLERCLDRWKVVVVVVNLRS